MHALASFGLVEPHSLREAIRSLAATPGARIVAGGTDLVANLRHGLGTPPALIDVSGVPELGEMIVAESGTWLGAGVTLAKLARDAAIGRLYPALAEAARCVAGPAHRSAATLGGNLCVDTRCVFYNQSAWWRAANDHCLKYGGTVCHVAPQGKRCHAAFSGDLAPALLVLEAMVSIEGPRGARLAPLGDLYVEDGAAHLALEPGELVAGVCIPVQPPGARSGYRKARVRGAVDFPLAGVAARLVMDGERVGALRVALTGTNSRPFLLEGVGEVCGEDLGAVIPAVAKLVQRQVTPMRTTAAAANYRRGVAMTLARRLVRDLGA